jgi:thymidylate kinase
MTVAATVEARAVHPLLAAAFSAFDEHELRWCVLRGEDELGAPGDDVDLLVGRSDLDRAAGLLAALGFAHLPAWGRGSHTFFVAYDADHDRWLRLDVVTDVRFGAYQTLRVDVAGELLDRRERSDGVPALAPSDAFWMLVLHCLLDKDGVSVKHRTRLQELAEQARAEGTLPGLVERAGFSASRLRAAVASGHWAALDEDGHRLRRTLTHARRVPVNRLLRAADRTARALRSPGLTVALLAPDGAGKSTLATALLTSFPEYDVRIVYMGLYRQPGRAVRLPGLYLASRLALAWARYVTAGFHRAAGRLVVLDRYVYDALLPPTRAIGRLHRAHRWLVARSLPAPDLVLVLDAPGRTAFARKGENDAGSLERDRRALLALSARIPGARVVDASVDAERVRRHVVSLIWNARVRRGR